MKTAAILCLIFLVSFSGTPDRLQSKIVVTPAGNLIVVVIDGFRWQELFSGADPRILNDSRYTSDSATISLMYGGYDEKSRRERLLPFMWHVVGKKGQIYGNRRLSNKVNNANIYSVSYPGYNEIFTGNTDLLISSNKKKMNPHVNVLEYLSAKPAYQGKVVAFSSWDVFPFILNEPRSGMLVNSGNEVLTEAASERLAMVTRVQEEKEERVGLRHDQLTFITAMEYMAEQKPKVVMIGLGQTDDYAHIGDYDLYLEQANEIDRMLSRLWHWVQSTPGYKDNTHLLITTDHGRGRKSANWTSHSAFIAGSSETWWALLGPGVEALGEVEQDEQRYQSELPALMAGMLGERFQPGMVRR